MGRRDGGAGTRGRLIVYIWLSATLHRSTPHRAKQLITPGSRRDENLHLSNLSSPQSAAGRGGKGEGGGHIIPYFAFGKAYGVEICETRANTLRPSTFRTHLGLLQRIRWRFGKSGPITLPNLTSRVRARRPPL